MRLNCNHDISYYDFDNKICGKCEESVMGFKYLEEGKVVIKDSLRTGPYKHLWTPYSSSYCIKCKVFNRCQFCIELVDPDPHIDSHVECNKKGCQNKGCPSPHVSPIMHW